MQVGILPVRLEKGRLEVCVVKSRRQPGRYTLPKGGLKQGEDLHAGAQRELYEEAGLSGKILLPHFPILLKKDKSLGRSCVFFILLVQKTARVWPEAGVRKRKWVHAEKFKKSHKLTKNAQQVLNLFFDKELESLTQVEIQKGLKKSSKRSLADKSLKAG